MNAMLARGRHEVAVALPVNEVPQHDPFQIRRLPLARDVVEEFAVVAPVCGGDDPRPVSRTVCRMPDGRFVLVETSGAGAAMRSAVIGEPLALTDALNMAQRVLAGEAAEPLTAHCLALAVQISLRCALDDVWRLPQARSGA